MCEKMFMTADDLQYFDDASRARFADSYRDDVTRLNVQNGLKACGSPLYSARKLEQWQENECFMFYTITKNPHMFDFDINKVRKEGEAIAKKILDYYHQHKEYCDKYSYIPDFVD